MSQACRKLQAFRWYVFDNNEYGPWSLSTVLLFNKFSGHVRSEIQFAHRLVAMFARRHL